MRNFRPLELTPLPDLPGNTEVLLLTSNLEPSPGETWRQSIALVMVSPSDLQRRQARALMATFITIRGSFNSPPQNLPLGEWLAGKLVSTEPDSVIVILALPEGHPTSECLVARGLPQMLRDNLNERLDLLLLVADATVVLPEGFHSMVQGGMEQALQLLEITSALMAPTMAICCDVYDLVEMMPQGLVFRVVSAMWLLEENRLLLPSSEAQAWLPFSHHIVVALRGEGRLNAVRRMAAGIREQAPLEANHLQIYGCGHRTAYDHQSDQVLHMLVLCAVEQ